MTHPPDESDFLLRRLGPQSLGDTLHSRRCRFHQSWYRSEILGLEQFGSSLATRHQLSGSVLTVPDGDAGENFLSLQAIDAYATRRSQGWGVDPEQTTRHMVSSQALMFNLMAPLVNDPEWFLRSLRAALGRTDIRAVHNASYEFAPARRSHYLNDMTRVDVLLDLDTDAGAELMVIELKYADRFNSRRLALEDRTEYRDLAARTRVWVDSTVAFTTTRTNQLLRMHALALSISERDRPAGTTVSCLVIHHARDQKALSQTEIYRALLADPGRMTNCALNRFVAAMTSTAQTDSNLAIALSLSERYVEESGSADLWDKHVENGRQRVGRP